MTIPKGFQQQLSKRIIIQAQSGDLKALEAIYETYSNACYNLAFRICGDRNLALDIVQETFIQIINKINQFQRKGSFSGWVRKIVANETIDRIRSEQKLHVIEDLDSDSYPSNDLFGIEWLDAKLDISFLLDKLSDSSRAVLMLHELEGYTHKEIAKMFGKSESYSKTVLSRAYSKLRILASKSKSSQGEKNASNG